MRLGQAIVAHRCLYFEGVSWNQVPGAVGSAVDWCPCAWHMQGFDSHALRVQTNIIGTEVLQVDNNA